MTSKRRRQIPPHSSRRRAHQPRALTHHPHNFTGYRGARHRPRPESEEPAEGQCQHIKSKTPSDEGECVPEVGLELHSSPCKHWEVPETYRIRPSPADVRPSSKRNLLTVSTRRQTSSNTEPTPRPLLGEAAAIRNTESLPHRDPQQTFWTHVRRNTAAGPRIPHGGSSSIQISCGLREEVA